MSFDGVPSDSGVPDGLPDVRTFPAADHAFATEVEAALDRAIGRTADEVDAARVLEAELRHVHPRAVVRPQSDLGGIPGRRPVWYVYRDGRLRPTSPASERLYAALGRARMLRSRSAQAMTTARSLAREAGYPMPEPPPEETPEAK